MITKLTDRAVLSYKPEANVAAFASRSPRVCFSSLSRPASKVGKCAFAGQQGRIGKLTLGRVDASGRELKDDPEIGEPLTLAAARQLAAKVHRERELGRDPIAEHKARKHRRRGELIHRSNNMFAAAARAYVEDPAKPKQRRWPETARLGIQPHSLEPIVANELWQLPGSRTKNSRSYKLLPMALALIPPGQHGLVFSTTGTTPPSGWSRAKRRLEPAMLTTARQHARNVSLGSWRQHDLRRTAVTGMAELGVTPDVIELCVNHVSGSRGGIAGVYNHSELLPERKAALERWSAHVAGLVSGGMDNVVALHQRQAGAA